MTEEISILITGNPNTSSGATNIGSIGSGLNIYDPSWPSTVNGKYALIISDDETHSYYCLSIKPSLITVGGRTGVLNFQLRIPHNCTIADAEDNEIDSYSFLILLLEKFEKTHLQKYPGVEGWNFADDGKMSENELKEFLAPYTLKNHALPSRYLTGTNEGTIILSDEKLKAFAIDHAYPELSQFGKIWLSTDGMTTPDDLCLLKVPRTPEYDVYVNGVRQDCILREGDNPFTILVNPKKTWQEPKELRIDIASGKIDKAKERIDFETKFEDKTVSRIIKVELQGLDDEKERKKIIRDILNSIVPESKFGPITTKTSISEDNNSIIVTTTGEDTLKEWKPVCRKTIDNVSDYSCSQLPNGNYNMVFKYAKPVVETRSSNSGNQTKRTDTLPEPPDQVKEVEFFLTPENDNYIDDLKNLTFNLKLSEGRFALYIRDIAIDGIRETRTLPSKKQIDCYCKKISLDSPLYNMKRPEIKVTSNDSRYVMTIDNVRTFKDKFLVINVKRLSKMQHFNKTGRLSMLVLLLMVFAAGWFIGEYFNPVTSISNTITNYVSPKEKSDTANTGLGQVDSVANTGAGSVMEQATIDNSKQLEQKEDQSTAQATAETSGSILDESVKRQLNASAQDYLTHIKAADLSFQDVRDIQGWVNQNKSNKAIITGFATIESAIGKYAKCVTFFEDLPNIEVTNDVAKNFITMSQNIHGGDTLRNLRIKLQKFYLNQNNKALELEAVKDKLFDFVDKPKKSFKDL